MLHRHGESVEEDQYNDEPVKPLFLHRFSYPKTHFLFVHPEIRILLELFLECQAWGFLLLQQLFKGQRLLLVVFRLVACFFKKARPAADANYASRFLILDKLKSRGKGQGKYSTYYVVVALQLDA